MIHLVAVKIGSRKWAVIPSDVQDVREKIYLTVKKKLEDKLAEKEIECPDKLIKKMRESGSEDQPHWSVIYEKEPVSE